MLLREKPYFGAEISETFGLGLDILGLVSSGLTYSISKADIAFQNSWSQSRELGLSLKDISIKHDTTEYSIFLL